jgi:CDP-glucose 4,6-dehydratase
MENLERSTMKPFNNYYYNKKILITGNTGFKGSWLSLWLQNLGAKVYGLSIDIPTNPSLYEILNLTKIVNTNYQDIRNIEDTKKLVDQIRPDIIFHLAAQPIVKLSYNEPYNTFTTNALGTTTILEVLRQLNIPCTLVLITSDKCYDNVEWLWGYRETDKIGGKDPYSASKGMAELVINSYCQSFFKNSGSKVRALSVRAGNVIGGGDWAESRIVPDAIKAWNRGETLLIRSPNATRPWQHVLEPLSGYLLAGWKLSENSELLGEAFNFGPDSSNNYSVAELLEEMKGYWIDSKWAVQITENAKEAGLLKLNCDKALHHLGWTPTMNFNETVEFTVRWYQNYYLKNQDMTSFTVAQINEYMKIAQKASKQWI